MSVKQLIILAMKDLRLRTANHESSSEHASDGSEFGWEIKSKIHSIYDPNLIYLYHSSGFQIRAEWL